MRHAGGKGSPFSLVSPSGWGLLAGKGRVTGGRAVDFALPDRLRRSKHEGRKPLAQSFPFLCTPSVATGCCLLAPFSSSQGCPLKWGDDRTTVGQHKCPPSRCLGEEHPLRGSPHGSTRSCCYRCCTDQMLWRVSYHRQLEMGGWMGDGWMDGNGPPDGFVWDRGRDGRTQ